MISLKIAHEGKEYEAHGSTRQEVLENLRDMIVRDHPGTTIKVTVAGLASRLLIIPPLKPEDVSISFESADEASLHEPCDTVISTDTVKSWIGSLQAESLRMSDDQIIDAIIAAQKRWDEDETVTEDQTITICLVFYDLVTRLGLVDKYNAALSKPESYPCSTPSVP